MIVQCDSQVTSMVSTVEAGRDIDSYKDEVLISVHLKRIVQARFEVPVEFERCANAADVRRSLFQV